MARDTHESFIGFLAEVSHRLPKPAERAALRAVELGSMDDLDDEDVDAIRDAVIGNFSIIWPRDSRLPEPGVCSDAGEDLEWNDIATLTSTRCSRCENVR